ncbi:GFA family protein [Pseudomonas asiatica]|nr:GFA family protein [Pseudomonas asiatica]MDM9587021.1 GFA family protein [Pseudomonas asiatica]WJM54323.1 GFA family protein [Pseudomonas asiatica]
MGASKKSGAQHPGLAKRFECWVNGAVTFNTHVAKHYFCSKCGIYTFHQRRSSPDQYGVNVACIEGMSPFDFPEVPVSEGRIHPKDRVGGGSVTAGWLRYESNHD